MSLAQLKVEAARLTVVEQRKLIAFLVSLQTEKDKLFRQSLTQKIEDTDSALWVELDELKQRYPEMLHKP